MCLGSALLCRAQHNPTGRAPFRGDPLLHSTASLTTVPYTYKHICSSREPVLFTNTSQGLSNRRSKGSEEIGKQRGVHSWGSCIKKSRKSGPSSRARLALVLVLTEEVGGPVGDVEECEDQRECDARDDVDAFRARRELGEPGATETLARRLLHVHLTVHLLQGQRVSPLAHQRLLKQGATVARVTTDATLFNTMTTSQHLCNNQTNVQQ